MAQCAYASASKVIELSAGNVPKCRLPTMTPGEFQPGVRFSQTSRRRSLPSAPVRTGP